MLRKKKNHKEIIWHQYTVSTPEYFTKWLKEYTKNLSEKEVIQLKLSMPAWIQVELQSP